MAALISQVEKLSVGVLGFHKAQLLDLSGEVIVVLEEQAEPSDSNYSTVTFRGVLAYRYSTEPAAFELGDYPNSIDQIVEDQDSDFLRKVTSNPVLGGLKPRKHYVVTFSNCGLLSIIAQNYRITSNVDGRELSETIQSLTGQLHRD